MREMMQTPGTGNRGNISCCTSPCSRPSSSTSHSLLEELHLWWKVMVLKKFYTKTCWPSRRDLCLKVMVSKMEMYSKRYLLFYITFNKAITFMRLIHLQGLHLLYKAPSLRLIPSTEQNLPGTCSDGFMSHKEHLLLEFHLSESIPDGTSIERATIF